MQLLRDCFFFPEFQFFPEFFQFFPVFFRVSVFSLQRPARYERCNYYETVFFPEFQFFLEFFQFFFMDTVYSLQRSAGYERCNYYETEKFLRRHRTEVGEEGEAEQGTPDGSGHES